MLARNDAVHPGSSCKAQLRLTRWTYGSFAVPAEDRAAEAWPGTVARPRLDQRWNEISDRTQSS